MSSRSSANAALRYAATRLCTARIALLLLLLLLASLASSRPANAAAWATDLALAVLLVVPFRLWDDLADAPADRVQHPERVLPQQATLQPFWIVLLLLIIASVSLTAWLRTPPAVLGLLAAIVLLAATYRWVSRDRHPLTASLLILLKYPVLVLILGLRDAPEPPWPLLASMSGLYLLLFSYELIHDPRFLSRRQRRSTTEPAPSRLSPNSRISR